MKVIAIIGKKKSGKTTLIGYLIPYLKEYGKVGCIKHAHELDPPTAKDTDRFFNVGAEVVIGSSGKKMVKLCSGKNLDALIDEMANSGMDFVLVEGFKSSDLPKIALSDFPDEEVRGIIKRIKFSGTMRNEQITEIIKLVRSVDDYKKPFFKKESFTKETSF
jgi:molybdopterin-guanine dinucleotide biosynthesis protein MobB